MKDLTENQKQFIRNWVAIRNTEVEEIDGEIDKVIQNSPITKKEFLDILDTLKLEKNLYEELEDMIYAEDSDYFLEDLKDEDLLAKNSIRSLDELKKRMEE
tara:strand:- start:405 stop:707 length:303 start_codon:yes stop_codon:yes gene_type:complete